MPIGLTRVTKPVAAAVLLPKRVHRDQRGTISIISVFAVMLLTMLLGMVMNVGRQVDGKIRMQNSAGAAAYSGTVVLTRSMNTLTFTNHLLSDVFALTAFMREARDRNAESFVADVLAAWAAVAPKFIGSGFPKFESLGPAILQKIPLEQQLVSTYGQWAAATSERVLPLLEEILVQEMIPQYQRAVVEAFPDIAQMAAREVSRRNGEPDHGRGEMQAVLWRASGQPVGDDAESADPTLPVVDPVWTTLPEREEYLSNARRQRRDLAHRYLRQWNRPSMAIFDHIGKMSRFAALLRSFTCGQLEKLLDEYHDANLPHMIRKPGSNVADTNQYLEENFTFIATVYWGQLPEMLPGLFQNPTDNDAVAFAEARMFIPRGRLVWRPHSPSRGGAGGLSVGVPGDFSDVPLEDENPEPGGEDDGEIRWRVVRQRSSMRRYPLWAWDLLNQRWTCQLVPATQSSLADILQTVPPVPGPHGDEIVPPDLGNLSSEDIVRISPH